MKKFLAFSLVELMVALILISCIVAAMTPTITKKLHSQGITVGSGGGGQANLEFSQDCSAWQDCALCFSDRCAMCAKTCLDNEYVEVSSCSCKSCDKFENCLECSSIQCRKCEAGYYLDGTVCKICPIGSYCDGSNKITCEEGKYTDSEAQISCKTCEVGYACSNGIKSPCEAGYYTSDMGQSSCKTCEKGYYCTGSSNKNQCSGATYQDNTAQSSCKDCSTNGYYVSDDKTSCTVCEAGNMCTSGIKSQCAAGKYSSAGASSCTNCQAGKYSSAGSSSCTNCAAGKYSLAGASSCTNCAAGKYSSAGASSCTNCSAGYTSTAGSSSCTKCTAGTYNSTAGSSSCATCPKGYYCTGGTNKTSCGEGKYLATTGNDASSDCKTCASKTANCTKCNLTTGVCSECADGYVLQNGVCEEDNPCGDLAMEVTLNGKNLCMTKYNLGDNPSLGIADTISIGTVGYTGCSATKCCWNGNTGGTQCDSAGGTYSGCNRTVCNWHAAKEGCSKLTYLNKTWRLPTSNELNSLISQLNNVSIRKGDEGLQLCDSHSGYSSSRCYYTDYCSGASPRECRIYILWSLTESDSTSANDFQFTAGSARIWTDVKTYPFSVRCVSEL